MLSLARLAAAVSVASFAVVLGGCAVEAPSEETAVHVDTTTTTAPDALKLGTTVNCHFTVAGCPGEGPDGFSTDNSGGYGGDGARQNPASGIAAAARASAMCASRCATDRVSGYPACNAVCASTHYPHVVHLPGVGFVPIGTPAGDGSDYASCAGDCQTNEVLCMNACVTGGVY
ncbi:MAG: hypothetical protein JWP87_6210 [Labilithrix sp.]|nr:hypothetical protein [Labilithrix sp.]